jgi:hypothetical protein
MFIIFLQVYSLLAALVFVFVEPEAINLEIESFVVVSESERLENLSPLVVSAHLLLSSTSAFANPQVGSIKFY